MCMAPRTEADLFLQLSEVLAGVENLDSSLGSQYLARLKEQYPKEVSDLLGAFSRIVSAPDPDTHKFLVSDVKSQIVENAKLAPIAQQVIIVWYTAQFAGPDGKLLGGTQEQFYAGLLWSVIHAHAPTHPTEPFGSWHHHPKEE